MITQKCKKCSLIKPADTAFYVGDYTCKECRKARVRENRRKNIEHYREYDRQRANRKDRVKARLEYSKTKRGIESANKAKKAWAEKNKKKRWVSCSVNNAIRDGVIAKPQKCSHCGKINCRIEGHHDDYNRPLDVTWLCSVCHRQWHKRHGEGKNAT